MRIKRVAVSAAIIGGWAAFGMAASHMALQVVDNRIDSRMASYAQCSEDCGEDIPMSRLAVNTARVGVRKAAAVIIPVPTTITPNGAVLTTDPPSNVTGGHVLPTGEVIQEDDPRWDCATMGNMTCGDD